MVYELEGLSDWTALPRAVNGHAVPAVSPDPRGAGGGLQVEEIASGWLHSGDNVVTFAPALARGSSPAYLVRNLRLVGVERAPEAAPVDGSGGALVDGDDATGLTAAGPRGSAADAELHLGEAIDPQIVSLRLTGPARGEVTITALPDEGPPLRTAKVELALDGLSPGWHHLPIAGALPVARRFRMVARGDRREGGGRGIVSELRIGGAPLPRALGAPPPLQISHPLHGECDRQAVYLRGFATEAPLVALVARWAGARDVPVSVGPDGSFAGLVPVPPALSGGGALRLEGRLGDGRTVEATLAIEACLPVAKSGPPGLREDVGAPFAAVVRAGEAKTLSFAGATLDVPAGAVKGDVRITIRTLAAGEARPMDRHMTNVAPDGRVFRFGPHGLTFAKPVKLTLPVARGRLPEEMRPGDVHGFYFDEAAGRWVRVPRAAGTAPKDALASLTTHFTDFVNATVVMPDHPGAESFASNRLEEIEDADPASGITLIEPPVVDGSGHARTSLPLELPPGRHGATPALSLTYASDAGSSWLGVGWDLKASSIEIDTRFGVPRYGGKERYLLDGELLRPAPGRTGPNGGPIFFRRSEGSFERIERVGSSPADFRWEVTGKDGTKRVYGATAAGRLASYVAPGPIFRWQIETVTDTFGNQIRYRYFTDSGNNGEPFRQLYLAGIDYASHPRAPAPYHVELERAGQGGTCSRADEVVDGRAGFQVRTRCLLDKVTVRSGEQIVRQYVFTYKTGNFGKTLLAGVALRGLDGRNVHYEHGFDYFDTPETDGTLDLFTAPTLWARAAHDEASHLTAEDEGDSQSGRVVVGFDFLGIGIGGSHASGNQRTTHRLFDLTGDALTDLGATPRDLELGALVGNNRTTPAGLTGLLQPAQSPTPFGDLSRSNRDFLGGEAGIFGIVGLSGNKSLSNRTREGRLMMDMNGDGLLDQFGYSLGEGKSFRAAAQNAGLRVRLNDGKGSFGEPQIWENHNLDHLGCEGPALFDKAKGAVGNLVRKVLPLTGQVAVQGAAAKMFDTTGKAVVSLFKNGVALWSHTFPSEDTTPCAPAPNNGCGGGLLVDVLAGDRLYMLMAPGEGNTGDLLSWDPQIVYTRVNGVPLTAAQQSLRDPDGGFIYRASQAADFRFVGRLQEPWVADAPGTVRVTSTFTKQATSDDVLLQVVRRDASGTRQQVLFSRALAAAWAGTLPLDLGPLAVETGDWLSFEVLSDLPIDPALADWRPVVSYDQYCRTVNGRLACGAVSCPDDEDDAPAGAAALGTQGGGDGRRHPVGCLRHGHHGHHHGHHPPPGGGGGVPVPLPPDGEDDPDGPPPACQVDAGRPGAFPLPVELAERAVPAFHPVFQFAPGVVSQPYVVTHAGNAAIAGVFQKRAPTAGRVVVAIQGVNRLFAKRVFAPQEVGAVPLRVQADGLAAGDPIFFTVLAESAT